MPLLKNVMKNPDQNRGINLINTYLKPLTKVISSKLELELYEEQEGMFLIDQLLV